MKKFTDCGSAISPVIGVILMVAITVIMASTIAASVFLFTPAAKAPYAVIEIKEVKGGLRYDTPNVRFDENWIILYHKGGDPLEINKTKIKIEGYGNAQNMSSPPLGSNVKGNLYIEYTNLGYAGKETNPGYRKNNPELSDGYWSTGERLTLNGQDSINGNDSSTVRVRMNNIAKTSNNWGFSDGKYIDITIIDISSQQVIAKVTSIVKQV